MIAGYFAARQRQYANFIKDIHNHIVETVLLKQKILEERDALKKNGFPEQQGKGAKKKQSHAEDSL